MDNQIRNIAITLISQYGDEAQTIAMLRAAEYAAMMDFMERYNTINLTLVKNIARTGMVI